MRRNKKRKPVRYFRVPYLSGCDFHKKSFVLLLSFLSYRRVMSIVYGRIESQTALAEAWEKMRGWKEKIGRRKMREIRERRMGDPERRKIRRGKFDKLCT